MGTGMSKILDGVYVGNFKDSKDVKRLSENQISHILAVHDNAKQLLADKIYLCITASDHPHQSLIPYFEESIDFIHKARSENGGVLVHCLAGMSRSVTLTAAYIMTITRLGWRDSLNAIRGARQCANPNFGFQRQLQEYEQNGLEEARLKLKEKYPNHNYEKDEEECEQHLKSYRHFLFHGDQCNVKNCTDDNFMGPTPPPPPPHNNTDTTTTTTTTTTGENESELEESDLLNLC